MGVEARIECGWIPSLQHGNGVFDGIDLVLDSQMHLKAFFCVGKERYDLQWATTLQEGNGSICLKTKETAAEHWFLHGQLDCRAG